jgi:predicted thioredoxin/glutaredoxin
LGFWLWTRVVEWKEEKERLWKCLSFWLVRFGYWFEDKVNKLLEKYDVESLGFGVCVKACVFDYYF